MYIKSTPFLVIYLIILFSSLFYSQIVSGARDCTKDKPDVVKELPLDGYGLMDLCNETGPGEARESEEKYKKCMSEIFVAVFVGFCMQEVCTPYAVFEMKHREVARKIFLKYMFNNMNEWHQPGGKLMIKALNSEWPCENEPILQEE